MRWVKFTVLLLIFIHLKYRLLNEGFTFEARIRGIMIFGCFVIMLVCLLGKKLCFEKISIVINPLIHIWMGYLSFYLFKRD